MRIVCPSCSTAYTVPDQKIGASGRKVRCARCATRWLAKPSDDDIDDEAAAYVAEGVDEPDTIEPTPEPTSITSKTDAPDADADAAEEDAFAAAFAEDEDAAEDELAASADFGGTGAKAGGQTFAAAKDDFDDDAPDRTRKPVEPAIRPRIVAHHRPRPSLLSRVKQVTWRARSFLFRSRITIGVVIFTGALILPGIGVMLRVPIVRAYPKVAGLFTELGMPVNLTGLEFRKLNTLRELENGQPVLVVEGAVGNLTMSSLAMPGLRLALRGADGQEIYAWSLEPKTATVPAGDEVRFRSRLAAPPEEAVDIQIRFTEPKTRHAVLP